MVFNVKKYKILHKGHNHIVIIVILGNPGVTHSVPTALMNAVGTEWVKSWVTEDGL